MGSPTPSIPEHLMFDVLVRLPIKSLMRLKLVCRAWCSLIHHSPAFAKSVFNRSNTQFVFAVHSKSSLTQQLFTATSDGHPALRILSLPWAPHPLSRFSNSINGLVCFNNGNEVYICNPSTRQTIMLPPSDFELIGNATQFVYFSKIFLGYNTHTQSYKVLKVRTSSDDGTILGLEILTVGTQSWRSLEGMPCYYDVTTTWWSNDALVNGAIYWEGMNKEDKKGVVVVAFDIAEERFEVIPPPTGVTCVYQIVERKGQLFLVSFKEVLGKFEVWMMKEEYEKKKKKKKVWVFQWWVSKVRDLGYLRRNPFDQRVRINGSDGEWTLSLPRSCLEQKELLPITETSSPSFFCSEAPFRIITGAAYVESIYSCLTPTHASTSFSY